MLQHSPSTLPILNKMCYILEETIEYRTRSQIKKHRHRERQPSDIGGYDYRFDTYLCFVYKNLNTSCQNGLKLMMMI